MSLALQLIENCLEVAVFKLLRYLFYLYVIVLAFYGTYHFLSTKRLTRPHVSFLKPKKDCFNQGDWTYCVHTEARTNKDVHLYALHGKGEDENFWLRGTNYAALLQSYWQKNEKEIPLVITVSFGPIWLATPKTSKPNTGILELFENEVFPIIEARLGSPRRRNIVGGSMGSLNSLSLALKFQNHFSKIALLCPPIFSLSPYASPGEFYHFLGRTGASLKSLTTIIGVGRMYFTNNEEWLNFSPLLKVQKGQVAKQQQYYISAGLLDEFGLFEGVEKLVRSLEEQNISVQWHPSTSHHCGGDIPSLAEFLAVDKKDIQNDPREPLF